MNMRFIIRKEVLFLVLLTLWIFPALSEQLEVAPDGRIRPFERMDYPLVDFVKEYAEVTGTRVIYQDKWIKNNQRINLIVKNPVTREKLKDYFITALEDRFTVMDVAGGLSLLKKREVRYQTFGFYSSSNFPKSNQFMTVVHRLKYPIGRIVSRHIKPIILSRYGRMITFTDQKTIIFKDTGNNIENALALVREQDNQETYENYLKRKEESAIEKRNRGKIQRENDELKKELKTLQKEMDRLNKQKQKQEKAKKNISKVKGGSNVA